MPISDVSPSSGPPATSPDRAAFSWARFVISLLIAVGLCWLFSLQTDLTALTATLSEARLGYVSAGLVIILLTILAKNWRWQLLFSTTPVPPFWALFWALILGQFTNLTIPIRLGDLARIYGFHKQYPLPFTATMSTIVIEKTVDLLLLMLMVALIAPIAAIPLLTPERQLSLTIAALLLLLFLFLLAWQATRLTAGMKKLSQRIGWSWGQRLVDLIQAGLLGLSALHNGRRLIVIISLSVVIAALSILTPWLLFPALDIPLGWLEAAILHIILTIGTIPASTPARIGVFEWLVLLTLTSVWTEIEQTRALSYALLYHLLVVLPPLGLGFFAVWKLGWPTKVARVSEATHV